MILPYIFVIKISSILLDQVYMLILFPCGIYHISETLYPIVLYRRLVYTDYRLIGYLGLLRICCNLIRSKIEKKQRENNLTSLIFPGVHFHMYSKKSTPYSHLTKKFHCSVLWAMILLIARPSMHSCTEYTSFFIVFRLLYIYTAKRIKFHICRWGPGVDTLSEGTYVRVCNTRMS